MFTSIDAFVLSTKIIQTQETVHNRAFRHISQYFQSFSLTESPAFYRPLLMSYAYISSYIFVSCIYRMFLSRIFVSCLCHMSLSHTFVSCLCQIPFPKLKTFRNFQPLSVSNSCMKCADLSSSCRRNIQRWLPRNGTGKIEYQRSQRNKQKCARTITVIK